METLAETIAPFATRAPTRPFAGRRALVTGASGGVGAALAAALHAAGADVLLVGRNRDRLHDLARRLTGEASATALCADLATPADIARLAERVAAGGALDLLVHCAGTIAWDSFADGNLADYESQFACNTRAPYLLTQALLPQLRAARGQVIFLNSTAGLAAKAGAAVYSATKHALKALADGLRDEVNPDGIRVMSVYLGRTDTAMQRDIFTARGLPYDGAGFLQPADVATILLPLLQLPASAEVTDFVLRPLRK